LKHLTLADEIVVLMLDDDTGSIKPGCASVANMAIAGGILMELALLGRIDTDLKSLFVVDPKPVDDELLDLALQKIAAEPKKRPSEWWIRASRSSQPRSHHEDTRTPGSGPHSSRTRQTVPLGVFATRLSSKIRAGGARSKSTPRVCYFQ
jgi:hypothetical protein